MPCLARIRSPPKKRPSLLKKRANLKLSPPPPLFPLFSFPKHKTTTTNIYITINSHFHAFMLEVHQRLHIHRQNCAWGKGGEAVDAVGKELAAEAKLLCTYQYLFVSTMSHPVITMRHSDESSECAHVGKSVVACNQTETIPFYGGRYTLSDI